VNYSRCRTAACNFPDIIANRAVSSVKSNPRGQSMTRSPIRRQINKTALKGAAVGLTLTAASACSLINPCAGAKPCGPCAAKSSYAQCGGCNPCNPCAAKTKNPCAANPCAAAKNPCAAANPCSPCTPCSPQ